MRTEIAKLLNLFFAAENANLVWTAVLTAHCAIVAGLILFGPALAEVESVPMAPTVRLLVVPEARSKFAELNLPGARITVQQKAALTSFGELVFDEIEVPSSLAGNLLARVYRADPATAVGSKPRFPTISVRRSDGWRICWAFAPAPKPRN